jgi:hypothetical protein
MRVQQELTKLPHRNSGGGVFGGIFGADVVHSSSLVRYCARNDFHNDGTFLRLFIYRNRLPRRS